MDLDNQYAMMDIILYLFDKASIVVAKAVPISVIVKTGVFDLLLKIKYKIKDKQIFQFTRIEIDKIFNKIAEENFDKDKEHK